MIVFIKNLYGENAPVIHTTGAGDMLVGKVRRGEITLRGRSLQAQNRREQEKNPGSKIPERHEHGHAVQFREARAFGRVRGRGVEAADDQTQLVHLRRQEEMMAGPIQRHQHNRRGFGQGGRGQETFRVAHGAERNERQYKEYL